MKPLYIFDLDGTLALIEHRRHFVERPRDQQDWDGFYRACYEDRPNHPIIEIMETLRDGGAELWIFSGRSDEVRKKTILWLAKFTGFSITELEGPLLQMRKAGDFTPDDILKKQWFDFMLQDDKDRLECVFDDRDRVVKMWRKAGVTCLQVANGEF